MALLAHAIEPRAASAIDTSPIADFWYGPAGMESDAGIYVGPDTMMRCGTALAAVRFLADSIAMSPPHTFRRAMVDGREARIRDREHYTHRVLRRPNAWMSGWRWRHLQMVHLMMYGNAFNRIIGGTRAFVEELRPLHPSRMRVIDQLSDGSLLYEYQNPRTNTFERLGQSDVLHFRGLSADGFSGAEMYRLIRNAVGVALVAEKHVASFLKKGTRLSGVLVHPSTMEPEAEDRAIAGWNRAYAGADNVGAVALLQGGMEFKPLSVDAKQAQLFELRDQQVGEILRFLGVPGVVVGFADKTATYASAEAFFEKGGIKHSVLPWITNLEAEIEQALLMEDAEHFVKFNLDALLRASTRDRYEAMSKAIGRPWMSPNEGRAQEDMNPDPDPDMDRVYASNQPQPAEPDPPEPEDDDEPPPAPPPPADGGEGDDQARRMARQFAADAAARVVRREINALRNQKTLALAAASDPAGWRDWVSRYYERHADHVAEALHLPAPKARAYAEAQAAELLSEGLIAASSWEDRVVPQLAALALGE